MYFYINNIIFFYLPEKIKGRPGFLAESERCGSNFAPLSEFDEPLDPLVGDEFYFLCFLEWRLADEVLSRFYNFFSLCS